MLCHVAYIACITTHRVVYIMVYCMYNYVLCCVYHGVLCISWCVVYIITTHRVVYIMVLHCFYIVLHCVLRRDRRDCNLSFAGLKTAVRLAILQVRRERGRRGRANILFFLLLLLQQQLLLLLLLLLLLPPLLLFLFSLLSLFHKYIYVGIVAIWICTS